MLRFSKRLLSLIQNGIAVTQDYTYVTFWQVRGFVFRINPDVYRHIEPHTQPKIPVVLIPGIYENWQFMKPVADILHERGHPIHTIRGLGYNVGSIEAMAAVVNEYLHTQRISRCIIVAHSKGGLVGKYLLAHYNEHGAILGIITLNTPFSGSKYARFIPLKHIRVFRPSAQDVSSSETSQRVNASIVSIYGDFDPHIPGGSYLEGARNIHLKTQGHFRILSNKSVHHAIVKNIQILTNTTDQ